MERYFGKYRASVVGSGDPLGRGRIQVRVPSLLGALDVWAVWAPAYVVGGVRPCEPPVGTAVLIEFLEGDPNQPIWTGQFLPDVTDIAAPEPVAAGTRLEAGEAMVAVAAEGVTLSFGRSRLTLDAGCITLTAVKIALDGHDIALGEGAHAPLVNGPALMSAFNTHLHNGGAAVTGPAVPPLTPAVFFTKVRAA